MLKFELSLEFGTTCHVKELQGVSRHVTISRVVGLIKCGGECYLSMSTSAKSDLVEYNFGFVSSSWVGMKMKWLSRVEIGATETPQGHETPLGPQILDVS
jgi:hypothetical protein